MSTNQNPPAYRQSAPTNKQETPPDVEVLEAIEDSVQTTAKLPSPILQDSWNPFASDFDPEIYSAGKSHFQITFLFVTSRERRQALTDFYAFCRLADDISDQEGLSSHRRATLLTQITEWIDREALIGHPFWDRFLNARKTFGIRKSSLIGIIEGVKMDLANFLHLQTWAELDRYVYGVACCVGEAVLCILGADGPQASAYSLSMGSCLQYLNIMRDLDEDQRNGRIYVPEEFLRGRSLQSCKTEVREELFKRAMNFRAAAKPYSWKCMPAELMAGIYVEGAKKYWKSGSSTRLSTLQKLTTVAKTILTFKVN